MWGFLLCSRQRRGVAELILPLPHSAFQENVPPGFLMVVAVISDHFPSTLTCLFSGTSRNVPTVLFGEEKCNMLWRTNYSLHFGTPIENLLGSMDGSSLCCFVLDQSWPAVCDQRWAVMPWNIAWWNALATGEDERLVRATNGHLFFSSTHLWSCHWEGKFPPCFLRRHSSPKPPPGPTSLRPCGLFWCSKSELIVVQAWWQRGLRYHPAPHPIFSTSDHFKAPNQDLPHSKEILSFLSVLHVRFVGCWSFRGKKRLLFSRNLSWPPQTLRCRCTTQIFFIAVFFSSGHWSPASPLRDLSPPSVSHLLFITFSSFRRAIVRLTSRRSFFCFEMYENAPALLRLQDTGAEKVDFTFLFREHI